MEEGMNMKRSKKVQGRLGRLVRVVHTFPVWDGWGKDKNVNEEKIVELCNAGLRSSLSLS